MLTLLLSCAVHNSIANQCAGPGLEMVVRTGSQTIIFTTPIMGSVQWHNFPISDGYVFSVETSVSQLQANQYTLLSKVTLLKEENGSFGEEHVFSNEKQQVVVGQTIFQEVKTRYELPDKSLLELNFSIDTSVKTNWCM